MACRGPIRGDNLGAPRLIREKIAALQSESAQMKAANTALRGLKGRSDEAMVQGHMLAIHRDEGEARKIVKPKCEQTLGRGRHPPIGRIAQVPPGADMLPNEGDDRGRIIFLLLGGEIISGVEDHARLL